MRRSGVILAVALGTGAWIGSGGDAAAWGQQTAGGGDPPVKEGAGGQTGGGVGGKTPATAAFELADDPVTLDSVGLAMRLPVGCKWEAGIAGSNATARVTPPDNRWMMNVRTPRVNDANVSLAEKAEQMLSALVKSAGVIGENKDTAEPDLAIVDSQAQLVERISNLRVNGQDAERFYIAIPQSNSKLVQGYTLFRSSADQFVVLELIVGEADFARARGVYEAIAATVRIEDPARVAESRGIAIEAGRAVMSALTPEKIDQILPQGERWYRLYETGAGVGGSAEEREVGYRRVRFWKGAQGEVNLARGVTRAADQTQGYLVRVEARLLEGRDVYDSLATYFVTPDRHTEAWSVQTTVRRGGAAGGVGDAKGAGRGLGKGVAGSDVATFVETGARAGTEMTVEVIAPGSPATVSKPVVPEAGYISQFEGYLLPRVLVSAGAEAEMAFYTYQSATGAVSLRRDQPARDPTDATLWVIATKLRELGEAQTSWFDEKGELLRTQLPDGRVWEPTDGESLMALWKAKGLPTGVKGNDPR